MIRSSSRPLTAFLLPALLIAAAVLWVYGPALRGGWVWDDVEEVTQNPVLRQPGALGRIWSAAEGPDYFPLKGTVQWLEWRAWGDDPVGYHAVNLALHLLSALLFWGILRRLGLRHGWIGGLLLAVHPLAVESVAWAAELKNTLSLALLLAAMTAYLEYDAQGSGRRADRFYWTSLFLFLCAMLSKTSVVMFPCAILLHAWWRRRIDGRDFRASAPFFAVSLVLGLVTLWFQHHRATIAGHEFAGDPLTRLAASGLALAFYLEKSMLPFGLLPVYPHWDLRPLSPLDFVPWLAFAALFGVLWHRRATWGRPALFGLGFFALNLLPVAGFVSMAYLRISRVADHLAYLPLLGILGLAAAALERLAAAARWTVLAGVIAVLAWQGRRHTEIFHDEITLWTYTLERNPAAWVAENDLGNAFYQAGHIPEAMAHLREALRLNPDLAEGHYNLGTVYMATHQTAAAIGEYEVSLRLKPGSPGVENNLGTALAQTGRLPESVGHFERAVKLDPAYADAHHNLGNAYLMTGRLADAAREYEAALRLRPDDAAARSALEMARRALQHGRGPSPAFAP
jgi:tetratricopeptide (TPR) repeat protein